MPLLSLSRECVSLADLFYSSRRLVYFIPPFVEPYSSRSDKITNTCQNLIPLIFIRPLRLCLPQKTLRSVRIVLLKVTHLPFVALIWAYEESRRLLSRKDLHSHHPRVSPLAGGRPFSASQIDIGRDRTHRAPILRTAPMAANLLASQYKVDYSRQGTASIAEGNADLLSLVQKLSTQVDALTSMVAGQQKD
jgi:hypothetical protein